MHAKCVFYFLIVLVGFAFLPVGPDSGWAAEQNKSDVFIAHVASFKNAANAEKYSTLLENKGMKAWTNKMIVPEKGEFYRVYVGSFDNRKSAVKAMQELKRQGIIPYFAIEAQGPALQKKGDALPKTEETNLFLPKSDLPQTATPVMSETAPQSPETAGQEKSKRLQEAPPAQLTEGEKIEAKPTDKITTLIPEPAKEELKEPVEAAAPVPHPDKEHQNGPVEPEVASFDPTRDASFYYNQGIKYLVKEQFDQALLSFSNAIRINSKFTEGFIKRGDAWYLKGDYEMAINDYNTAIALKPDYSESYLGRGLAYKNLGQVKKSGEDLSHACQLGSEEACALLNVWPKASTPQQ